MLLIFFTALLSVFVAEMGDKTQLMLVAMSSRYKLRHIILGTAVAILVLNGLAVALGGTVGKFVPEWLTKLVASAAFLYFAVTTLIPEDEEEDNSDSLRLKIAPVAVFCTFFIAELGDKTQLEAITFGAVYGLSFAVVLWLACSIGLFLADMVGMVLFYLFKNKLSDRFLKILSFAIFAVFGFVTLFQALSIINKKLVIPVIASCAVLFIVTSILLLRRNRNCKN